MENDNYFVQMDIESRGELICRMVWCDRFGLWRTLEQEEEFGFRGVSRLTSKQAYDLVEEMSATKFLRSQAFSVSKAGDLDVRVGYHDRRAIYVLFDWDDEEGATKPLSKVRCDGWYTAERFFSRGPGPLQRYQIRHISDQLCVENWDAIANLPLEADLILEAKKK